MTSGYGHTNLRVREGRVWVRLGHNDIGLRSYKLKGFL